MKFPPSLSFPLLVKWPNFRPLGATVPELISCGDPGDGAAHQVALQAPVVHAAAQPSSARELETCA
jgi:hypothetical protein